TPAKREGKLPPWSTRYDASDSTWLGRSALGSSRGRRARRGVQWCCPRFGVDDEGLHETASSAVSTAAGRAGDAKLLAEVPAAPRPGTRRRSANPNRGARCHHAGDHSQLG